MITCIIRITCIACITRMRLVYFHVEPGNLGSLPLLSSIVRECHQKLALRSLRPAPAPLLLTFNYISQLTHAQAHTQAPTRTQPTHTHTMSKWPVNKR